MAKQQKWHGGRALLNRPGFQSTAAIVAEIEDTSAWKPGKDSEGDTLTHWNPAPSINLQISDCSRVISFDFDMETRSGRLNGLHKIDTMIRLLAEFRSGLYAENERYAQRQEHITPWPADS